MEGTGCGACEKVKYGWVGEGAGLGQCRGKLNVLFVG